MTSYKNTNLFKTFLLMASIIIILAGIKAASELLIPLLLAGFIAVVMNPMVANVKRLKIPHTLSVFLVFIFVVGVLLSFTGILLASLNQFTRMLPTYQVKLQEELVGFINWIESFDLFEVNRELFLDSFNPSTAIDMAVQVLGGFGNMLADTFFIVLAVIFILLEVPLFTKKISLLMNNSKEKLAHLSSFVTLSNNYIAIKTITSISTGLLVFLLLYWMDVDHPILWGTIAFGANYIPTIGSILAAIPAVLLTLVQLGSTTALLVALGYGVINVVIGNIIEPKFMGKGLGLSTLVVFLSLVFFGWLLGTVGMLLSIPLTMIVKIALESSDKDNAVALMLGDK